MKKTFNILLLLVAALFLLSTTASAVEEISPQSSDYIFGTYANITAGSNGDLIISFGVTGTAGMTELGASSIDIYENNGRTTTWIHTIYPTDPGCENMLGSGTYHRSDVTYTGTIGYKYYARVHLSASNSNGGDTITKTTPTVTATK